MRIKIHLTCRRDTDIIKKMLGNFFLMVNSRLSSYVGLGFCRFRQYDVTWCRISRNTNFLLVTRNRIIRVQDGNDDDENLCDSFDFRLLIASICMEIFN